MVLKLHNTLTKKEEDFNPAPPSEVKIYSCGPTVYNYAHIGNWRQMVANDLLRRVLEYQGYIVRHVMNVTDVDDKTINGSRAAGEPLAEFTKRYEKFFLEDFEALNCLPPTVLTHATEYIPQMIALIEKLLREEKAYQTSDGIYFKISSFPEYGKLSGRTEEEVRLPLGGSLTSSEDLSPEKQDSRDFALWKFQTPEDGEVGWEAPFGKGRPGWHIECSAMAMEVLGPTIDIHTGATDLIFPHHENEIAQSESATGQTFSRYWLHGGFLLVDGQKMSKSLGNVYTLRDLEAQNISPLAYRYWLLTGHYRSQVNFTFEAVRAAQIALHKLQDIYLEWGEEARNVSEAYKTKFLEALSDDLNLPQALALVWELAKDGSISPSDKRATLLDFDKVLGLNLSRVRHLIIPAEIQDLLNQREEARQNKDFAKADELRLQIEQSGYTILDTEKGPKLRLK